jgi:transcriptional repressor NrdR
MKCPKCSCTEDKVIDTRVSKDGDSIRRRRECLACGNRFTTYEGLLRTEVAVVKRDGTREDFDPEKLRKGLRRACWKRPVSVEQIEEIVRAITAEIEKRYQREISSQDLGQLVMEELSDLDHVAYVRFASVYRSFEDVGEFINEIQSLTDRQDKTDTAGS